MKIRQTAGWIMTLLVLGAFLPTMAVAQAKEIVWQVWITPNLQRAFYDDIAKAFVAKNPGISLKIVEANSGNDSKADNYLKLHVAAGDAPDVWTNFSKSAFADCLT